MIEKLSNIFSVLSDENRLKVYSVLLMYPDGLYVCELSSILNLPYYTISKNLKELENIGVIESMRFGKYMLYLPAKFQKDEVIKLNSLLIEMAKSSNFIDVEKVNKIIQSRSGIQCLCDSIKEKEFINKKR